MPLLPPACFISVVQVYRFAVSFSQLAQLMCLALSSLSSLIIKSIIFLLYTLSTSLTLSYFPDTYLVL